MICTCAQSLASLANLFSPLPANVAAMGSVNANSGAQAALSAAMSASATAATTASFSSAVAIPFSVSAMASLTALANGIGALRLGFRTNLTGGNCIPTLEQLAQALMANGLMKALGGLPLNTAPPLMGLAQLVNAMMNANALGVGLLAPNAAAQMNAMAAASASASASVSASAALSMQAFLNMQMALSANLGINIGAPGGIGMLGSCLNTLGSNMSALNALNGLLNMALLAKLLDLLNALAAIQKGLGLNMLLPGVGIMVQPKLLSLSKSFSPSLPSKSRSAGSSKSLGESRSKSLNQAVNRAYTDGLGNLFSGLPILPPATLLLAYLLQKLLAQLGVGVVQYSQCGPLCLISSISLPCPFVVADFADKFAEQGKQLAPPSDPTAHLGGVTATTSTSASSSAGGSASPSADVAANAGASAGASAGAAQQGEAVQYGAATGAGATTGASAETSTGASPTKSTQTPAPAAAPPPPTPPPSDAGGSRSRRSWWKK